MENKTLLKHIETTNQIRNMKKPKCFGEWRPFKKHRANFFADRDKSTSTTSDISQVGDDFPTSDTLL